MARNAKQFINIAWLFIWNTWAAHCKDGIGIIYATRATLFSRQALQLSEKLRCTWASNYTTNTQSQSCFTCSSQVIYFEGQMKTTSNFYELLKVFVRKDRDEDFWRNIMGFPQKTWGFSANVLFKKCRLIGLFRYWICGFFLWRSSNYNNSLKTNSIIHLLSNFSSWLRKQSVRKTMHDNLSKKAQHQGRRPKSFSWRIDGSLSYAKNDKSLGSWQRKKKSFLLRNFANSEVLLCDTKQFFFSMLISWLW